MENKMDNSKWQKDINGNMTFTFTGQETRVIQSCLDGFLKQNEVNLSDPLKVIMVNIIRNLQDARAYGE